MFVQQCYAHLSCGSSNLQQKALKVWIWIHLCHQWHPKWKITHTMSWNLPWQLTFCLFIAKKTSLQSIIWHKQFHKKQNKLWICSHETILNMSKNWHNASIHKLCMQLKSLHVSNFVTLRLILLQEVLVN